MIRSQPDTWAALNTMSDEAELALKIRDLAAENGFDLSPDDIKNGLSSLPDIIAQAVETDELSDDELELVAAGVLMRVTHEHKML